MEGNELTRGLYYGWEIWANRLPLFYFLSRAGSIQEHLLSKVKKVAIPRK
jgi:hypothetical protein